MSQELLTIGMATHKEPEDVWFTLTALHANHPKVRYVVVDNSPERCRRTEAITRAVGGSYYHRPDLTGTSKPRDAVFRFAETPWVMCIDSHVILESGAVQAALDFARMYPDSRDIIQGPLVYDDGHSVSTHWRQTTPAGLWGMWDSDPGLLVGATAKEIPMMGLGLWLMRRAAWPGFNPLFRGFGGEEGYTHEAVRQRGGKALCLPALRWRHKFRDTSGPTATPYPLSLEDHTNNLLVGHRELGIAAEPDIFEHFGRRLPQGTWQQLLSQAEAQPFGGARPEPKRQRILAVWYSDNHAPLNLTMHSLSTVVAASQQTRGHSVQVAACSWDTGNFGILPGMGPPVINTRYEGERRRGYDTILAQIKQAVREATRNGEEYDAVAFCEHDVLYPPDYFNRVGDALAAHPGAPVISNLDYLGLNQTGWQAVKERHEPLHQLTLRWDTFRDNLARAEDASKTGGEVVLEPDHGGDRSRWVRLQPVGLMPSVHVNHNSGRLTSHGEVCYHPVGFSLKHPHWGDAARWWPGTIQEVQPVANSGCGACETNKHDTLEKWYSVAASQPSDFHEHVGTLKDLAANCESATELSAWMKPADIAIAAGLPDTGRFTSVCRRSKPQWKKMGEFLGTRFTGTVAEPNAAQIEPTDLLFVDTEHTADALYPILEANHGKVGKYIVVHCTEIYGESGDADGRPGVLHALRKFCKDHPEWVIKRRDGNNYGLVVLSRCAEDVKELPSLWRKAMNYGKAMAKHVAAGRPVVSLEVLETRQNECAVCPERALDACSACGCPLESKLPLGTEECPKGKW